MFDTNPKVFMSKVGVVEFGREGYREGYVNLFHISAILPVFDNSQCSRISLLGGRDIVVIGNPLELLKRFMREANGGHEIDSSAEGNAESD